MKIWYLSIILLVITVFGVLVPLCVAVDLSIGDIPHTFEQSQEFTVGISLHCDNCTSDSYLRGVLFPSGSNYFGFTLNNIGDWVGGSAANCEQFYKIAISDVVEGSWSGLLKMKVDPSSSLYSGPGEYQIKVGRYTSSCSSPTWSNQQSVHITGPTFTPTPSPTTSNSPTITPSKTPTPTPTPVVTKNNTPSLSTIMNVHMTQKPPIEEVPVQLPKPPQLATATAEIVLGQTKLAEETDEPTPIRSRTRPLIISMMITSIGFALLSGILAWQKKLTLSGKQGDN